MLAISKLENLIAHKLHFCQDLLPQETCLVGGVVRDVLLNRHRERLDLDFVLPKNAIETAKAIAYHYQAGFVILDAERQIARVVLKNQDTFDFALQEGEDLLRDLRRRDFTVNAIAYNLAQHQLIDPLDGVKDLENRCLKMISKQNLIDDPLRLLRAYRQAAQLNFTIESETRHTIQELASLLGNVAAERVRSEIDYLLHCDRGVVLLQQAWEDKLLKTWLSNINENKIRKISQISQNINLLSPKYPEFAHNLEWQYLVKLAFLVALEPEIAESELINLKYSREIIRNVTMSVKYLPKLQQAAINQLSLRERYFLFLELTDIFPIASLFAITNGVNITEINYLLEHYFNANDQVAHPTSLVTGNDLIRELQLKPSPKIGKLLTEIQIARIEGKVKNKEDAIKFAQEILILVS